MIAKKLITRKEWKFEITRVVSLDREVTTIIGVRERPYLPFAERLVMEL